jgi:DNA-binding MarR family transcriptional regulator
MEKEIKISEREKACLTYLLTLYGYDQDCTYFRYIAKNTGLEERQVKRSVRSLARKGLAEYVRGLFDEDGFVAGSGYRATELGRKLGDKLEL